MKKIFLITTLIILVITTYAAAQYFGLGQNNHIRPYTPEPVSENQNGTDTAQTAETVEYEVVRVIENLEIPWSIVFTSPERMLIAERTGAIRIVVDEQLQPSALYTFTDVAVGDEEGLMGLVADPQYSENQFLYACYAYSEAGNIQARVVRLLDEGQTAQQDSVLIDAIPAARFHAGCELGFGPGGILYVSTGDGVEKEQAQNVDSLAGKFLRINPDGSIPSDNPFVGSPVYTLGHRNPQGFDWHPITGELYATEHGPSIFDGPAGGDEINLIRAGENYGWPEVSHEASRPEFVSPLEVYTPAVAPASLIVYSGKLFPQFTNTILFAGLRGENIFGLTINEDGTRSSTFTLLDQSVGRVREIIESPSGEIYFTTSNTDGRGTPASYDDAVYKLQRLATEPVSLL